MTPAASRFSRLAWGLAVVSGLACVAACSGGASTSPTAATPAFIYVADAGAFAQLFVHRADSAVPFSHALGNDVDPQSAAGRVVFSSDRDGNNEIYVADTNGLVQHRVTNNSTADFQPALSAAGDRIAYVTFATGIPRIAVVRAPALTDSGFATPATLATGAAVYVPEESPAWSPDGTRIAFVSLRTPAPQIFVVPADGGAAVQLTQEVVGAFAPVWSADGSSITYQAIRSNQSIVRISVATQAEIVLATDSLGIATPSCNAQACVAVTDPSGNAGDLVSFSAVKPSTPRVLMVRANHEREPALLVGRP